MSSGNDRSHALLSAPKRSETFAARSGVTAGKRRFFTFTARTSTSGAARSTSMVASKKATPKARSPP